MAERGWEFVFKGIMWKIKYHWKEITKSLWWNWAQEKCAQRRFISDLNAVHMTKVL
jgi:hypothetical protein